MMLKSKRLVALMAAVHFGCTPQEGIAGWVEQTIHLEPGWNAVYLEVEPYPARCDQQFLGLPIETVATFDPDFSSVEFIQDPQNDLVPELPDWRFYFPPSDPRAFSVNLFVLQAATPYLIECAEAATWTVVGRPRFVEQEWKPDAYNFVGFPVDPANPPTIDDWFAASDAHDPIDFWALDPAGMWQKVNTTSTTTLISGEAYWVFTNGSSDFQGPIDIGIPRGTDIDYERGLVEQEIEITSADGAPRNITLTAIPSEGVPDPTFPNYAGPIPLTYFGRSGTTTDFSFDYLDLPATLPFAPDETLPKQVRLAVDRSRMPNAPSTSLFQSVLEIKDDRGYRRRISVLSKGMDRDFGKSGLKGVGADADPASGLWVGDVVMDMVNEAIVEPPVFQLTAKPFQFRVMIHVNHDGTARLLNEAVQLWRDGTTKPDPNNPEVEIVDIPGRYVLVTPTAPASLLNEVGTTLIPATLRDGREFARRISTAAYPLHDENRNPIEPEMNRAGEFGQNGGSCEVTFTLHDNDPTNPFRHQYHPVHRYPEPGEIAPDWSLTWQMNFTFSSDPPDGLETAGWGDTVVGGTYLQTIAGLASNEPLAEQDPNRFIYASGTFRLQRASPVPVLNDDAAK
jgi:hypothetical protein